MKVFFKIILAALLIFIICFSFYRYYYFQLDGDLPAIVLPAQGYKPVMQDPFGLNVILHDAKYPATNRYFTHLALMGYFKNVPLWLQNFWSPIDSVYISCAVAKTIIHFFLIYLITIYVTNKRKIWDLDVLLVAALATPFFQTYGYYPWMGIIDNSITYTFFYALAISFVFLFFLPFLNAALGRSDFKFSWLKVTALAILIIIISFNGPLNAPVILLICTTSLLNYFVKNYYELNSLSFTKRFTVSVKNIPLSLKGLFGFAILIGLYSYYIGRNNSENFWQVIPLSERYSRLPVGFWYHYTFKMAQPLLIGTVVLNSLIIWKLNPDEEAKKMQKILIWFAMLSVLYIILLPLGGYRSYRENIIRYDTIIPITLGLILFYCYTTFYIIKHLQHKYLKYIYWIVILAISGIYFNADSGEVRKNNYCERWSIEQIAKSDDRVVFVDTECSIMDWGATRNANDSRDKTDLLLYWNVIKEQKLYYQK